MSIVMHLRYIYFLLYSALLTTAFKRIVAPASSIFAANFCVPDSNAASIYMRPVGKKFE